jgi:hypothetical protein
LVRSRDRDGSADLLHLVYVNFVRCRHSALVDLVDGDWDPLLDSDLVGHRYGHIGVLSTGDGHWLANGVADNLVHWDNNWLANVVVLHNLVGHDNGHLYRECFGDVDDNLHRLGDPTGDRYHDLHGHGHTDLLDNFHRHWNFLDLVLDDLHGDSHWLFDRHTNFI